MEKQTTIQDFEKIEIPAEQILEEFQAYENEELERLKNCLEYDEEEKAIDADDYYNPIYHDD